MEGAAWVEMKFNVGPVFCSFLHYCGGCCDICFSPAKGTAGANPVVVAVGGAVTSDVAGAPATATHVAGTPAAATHVAGTPSPATHVAGTPAPATHVAGTPAAATHVAGTAPAATPVTGITDFWGSFLRFIGRWKLGAMCPQMGFFYGVSCSQNALWFLRE